jgi:hypothetical protein
MPNFNLINKFGLTLEELNKILYFGNAFIAGSFPLSVFLNETDLHPNQDLDIFIILPFKYKEYDGKSKSNYLEYLQEEYISNFLQSKCYQKLDTEEIKRRNRENPTNPEICYLHSALQYYIKHVTTLQNITGRKIQLITIYQTDILQFLYTFDLNISRLVLVPKCINNKYTVDFYHNQVGYLNDSDFEDFENKVMRLFNPLNVNLRTRVKKYEKRGFILKIGDKPYNDGDKESYESDGTYYYLEVPKKTNESDKMEQFLELKEKFKGYLKELENTTGLKYENYLE